MAGEEPIGSLVDWDRSACLCDVGLNGYTAALCVAADGDDVAWLVYDAALSGDATSNGDANQPHEQLGPMPAVWRHRTALAPWRCGRPRADGGRCRQYVGGAGRACAWHSDRTSAP